MQKRYIAIFMLLALVVAGVNAKSVTHHIKSAHKKEIKKVNPHFRIVMDTPPVVLMTD